MRVVKPILLFLLVFNCLHSAQHFETKNYKDIIFKEYLSNKLDPLKVINNQLGNNQALVFKGFNSQYDYKVGSSACSFSPLYLGVKLIENLKEEDKNISVSLLNEYFQESINKYKKFFDNSYKTFWQIKYSELANTIGSIVKDDFLRSAESPGIVNFDNFFEKLQDCLNQGFNLFLITKAPISIALAKFNDFYFLIDLQGNYDKQVLNLEEKLTSALIFSKDLNLIKNIIFELLDRPDPEVLELLSAEQEEMFVGFDLISLKFPFKERSGFKKDQKEEVDGAASQEKPPPISELNEELIKGLEEKAKQLGKSLAGISSKIQKKLNASSKQPKTLKTNIPDSKPELVQYILNLVNAIEEKGAEFHILNQIMKIKGRLYAGAWNIYKNKDKKNVNKKLSQLSLKKLKEIANILNDIFRDSAELEAKIPAKNKEKAEELLKAFVIIKEMPKYIFDAIKKSNRDVIKNNPIFKEIKKAKKHNNLNNILVAFLCRQKPNELKVFIKEFNKYITAIKIFKLTRKIEKGTREYSRLELLAKNVEKGKYKNYLYIYVWDIYSKNRNVEYLTSEYSKKRLNKILDILKKEIFRK